MLLPSLKREFGKDVDLFVDCSIDDGIDAFKALALGAKAVNVGRSILPALQENGSEGVYARLKEMEKELKDVMAKTCSYDIEHITPKVIWDSSTGKPVE